MLSVRCRINKIAVDGSFVFDHPLMTGSTVDSVVYFAFFETGIPGRYGALVR